MSNEFETSAGTLSVARIGGDAPFVYMTDEMFGQLYDTPLYSAMDLMLQTVTIGR